MTGLVDSNEGACGLSLNITLKVSRDNLPHLEQDYIFFVIMSLANDESSNKNLT